MNHTVHSLSLGYHPYLHISGGIGWTNSACNLLKALALCVLILWTIQTIQVRMKLLHSSCYFSLNPTVLRKKKKVCFC